MRKNRASTLRNLAPRFFQRNLEVYLPRNSIYKILGEKVVSLFISKDNLLGVCLNEFLRPRRSKNISFDDFFFSDQRPPDFFNRTAISFTPFPLKAYLENVTTTCMAEYIRSNAIIEIGWSRSRMGDHLERHPIFR